MITNQDLSIIEKTLNVILENMSQFTEASYDFLYKFSEYCVDHNIII